VVQLEGHQILCFEDIDIILGVVLAGLPGSVWKNDFGKVLCASFAGVIREVVFYYRRSDCNRCAEGACSEEPHLSLGNMRWIAKERLEVKNYEGEKERARFV